MTVSEIGIRYRYEYKRPSLCYKTYSATHGGGGKGHVINIGSVGAFELYPGGNEYSGSRAALQTLSQSMRIDVLGESIRMTSIQPGMTRTEFGMLRWDGEKELADKAYAGIDCLYPEDVADVGLRRPRGGVWEGGRGKGQFRTHDSVHKNSGSIGADR
ncbi:MAG: SDR family NAD(P)-dependent oxidoreductase [Proteobacteria bacterium]|nr:SDR family NAD(P)-dependent oxidoreductase [Pseudomonadota bacterium]